MRVLVACEFSQIVTKAFRDKGHEAYSCDLEPCLINKDWHIQDDVLNHLDDGWDLMIGHPTCFHGDTLIFTKQGYKEISKIIIGEEVLTHLGRWRKVNDIQLRYVQKTLTINITGSSKIITTDEHPFLMKDKRLIWDNSIRRYRKWISESYWLPIGKITDKTLIGSVLPPIENNNQSLDDEHLWLMGVYVADGNLRWRNNKFEEVTFSIGLDKADQFKLKVFRKYRQHIEKSVSKFFMYNKDFCKTFAQFGRSCETKNLPGWIFTLPTDKTKIFLDGYLFGDGHFVKDSKTIISSSISKKLSAGIAVLMRKVYNKPSSLLFSKRSAFTVIEGRTVSQKSPWVVQCSIESTKQKSIIEGNYTWYQFKDKKETGGCWVYNLSVEEDESYLVEQCIVHNCTFLTNAGVKHLHDITSKKGVKAKIHGKARELEMIKGCDFFNKLKNCNIPKICLENPIPHGYAVGYIGMYNQLIQPWMFGHKESKAICLWLKNLPLLKPTKIVGPPPKDMRKEDKKIWHRIHYMGKGKGDRGKQRSIFYSGIAEAMANQWS